MSSQDRPKLMGFRKKDKGRLWARLVVRVNGLKQGRDQIKVFFPSSKFEPLLVTLNDETLTNKYLPNDILVLPSNFKVKYGDKGEIKINLRKAEAADWVDRWSPSRENNPPPSLNGTSLTSDSRSDNYGSSKGSIEKLEFENCKIEEE